MKKSCLMLVCAVFMFSGTVFAADYAAFKKDIIQPYGLYKKALALTSKQENKDKAMTVVGSFIGAWTELASKYQLDPPRPFAQLENFKAIISRPSVVGGEALELLNAGQVKKAHGALEEVRYVLWQMRVEAGITSLNDKVNDFHEAMEIVLNGLKEDDSPAHLAHIGKRYGAWLAIKWQEIGKIEFPGSDKAAFEAAVVDGEKAIAGLRESLATSDAGAAKKAGGMVKKAYKSIFFMPECS